MKGISHDLFTRQRKQSCHQAECDTLICNENATRLTTQSPVTSAVADEADIAPCSTVTLSKAIRAPSSVLSYLYSVAGSTTICEDVGGRFCCYELDI